MRIEPKKDMKVYISGAITGIPLDTAVSRFKQAESELTEKGHCPVNPINNGLDNTASWLDHMKADIRLLLDCDAIYMLVGWPDSRGAIIEKQLAQNLGLKVFLQKP